MYQEIKLTTFTVTQEYANQRLDRFLRKWYKNTNISLGTIYRWIRLWQVKVNNKKVQGEKRILINDKILLPEISQFDAYNHKAKSLQKKEKISDDMIKNMILFEDENWLVRNKPPHIVIHANVNTGSDRTMHEIMMKYVGENLCKLPKEKNEILKQQKQTSFWAISIPSFCFRLDRDTSGILIAAKTFTALQYLNKLIRERNVQKEYLAVVSWEFPAHKVISLSLTKTVDKKFSRWKMIVDPNGKPSFSETWCLKTQEDEFLGKISLVRVKITTGRMHQIRIHLAHVGYPIVGDLVYGNPVINRKLTKKYAIKRHLLHCYRYKFIDMNGENMSFVAPIPDDIKKIIKTIPTE